MALVIVLKFNKYNMKSLFQLVVDMVKCSPFWFTYGFAF